MLHKSHLVLSFIRYVAWVTLRFVTLHCTPHYIIFCRPSQGVRSKSLTMGKLGTTLLPSTCSSIIPRRPSQLSARLSSTRGTAGRPGPTMGRLLPRLAMACQLPELSKRQALAYWCLLMISAVGLACACQSWFDCADCFLERQCCNALPAARAL